MGNPYAYSDPDDEERRETALTIVGYLVGDLLQGQVSPSDLDSGVIGEMVVNVIAGADMMVPYIRAGRDGFQAYVAHNAAKKMNGQIDEFLSGVASSQPTVDDPRTDSTDPPAPNDER